ncbi:hypothetical protein GCM10017562_59130 [Streptomyces roseofulvus]|uniref:Luciferase-like domain-containing protein n=2 Tax=Streptomyces TaxID=1883 RepID=A0ABU4KK58_9ACTN|nr:hypothetical protein [Streptomyces roseolus]MDX2297685.1 hypothetical protein [Streptomyces roseolus]
MAEAANRPACLGCVWDAQTSVEFSIALRRRRWAATGLMMISTPFVESRDALIAVGSKVSSSGGIRLR